MVQESRIGWWVIGLAVAGGLFALGVFLSSPADPQRLVRRMQSQVEEVRGLKFKHDVVIHEQSPAEFQKQAQASLMKLGAPEREQVLRTLGLLASDETIDGDAVRSRIENKGASAEYEPYSGRLLIVKAPNTQQRNQGLDDMYARELYRALLDQHFDLKTYLDAHASGDELNHDEWLARRIVVEGDALQGSVLRRTKQELGHIPKYLPLEQALSRYSETDRITEAIDDPRMWGSTAARGKPRRDPDSVPTFVTQLIKSIGRDGLLFANALRERGWDQFEQLYTTSPPISTEQVLHPQKWFAHERPLKIEWPAFEREPALADWELVEQNVLGELMLRTVFRVYRLSTLMGSSPEGWNGDRYAVFKRRDSGDMLLLLYTAWDDESEALGFAESYRVILEEKRAEGPKPARILQDGRRVVIVEGGDESSLDVLMKFARSAREIADTNVER